MTFKSTVHIYILAGIMALLFLAKPNRNKQGIKIIFPVAIVLIGLNFFFSSSTFFIQGVSMINIYMFFTIALGIIFLLLGFEFANRMDRTKLFLCMALFLIAVPFLALISKYPGGQWKTGVHFILIFISISFGFVSAFFIADNNKRTALLSNELFYSFLLWSILLTSIWMAVFLTASDILNLVKISVSGALIKGILGGIATSAVFLPFMIFFVQNDFYRRRARLISLFFDNLSMMDDYDVTRELKNEIKKDESLNGHVNSYSTNYPADNDDRRY